MTNETEEELRKKLAEIEERKATEARKKQAQKKKEYEEGLGILEGKIMDDRKDLSKNFGGYVPTTIVNSDINKLLNLETKKIGASRVNLEDHPLVKDKGFAAHEHGSEILAKFGLTKDSFRTKDRGSEGMAYRQVMSKTQKMRDGTEHTTTVVGGFIDKQNPDFVNITVTDPKTKTSYSQSVGTAFIDKDPRDKATDEELKAAADRVGKLLPKDAISKYKLQDLLKQGEAVRVERVDVKDKEGKVHTHMTLRALDKFGEPVKDGTIIVATQVADKDGRVGSTSIQELTAEDLRKKGAQTIQPLDIQPGKPEKPKTTGEMYQEAADRLSKTLGVKVKLSAVRDFNGVPRFEIADTGNKDKGERLIDRLIEAREKAGLKKEDMPFYNDKGGTVSVDARDFMVYNDGKLKGVNEDIFKKIESQKDAFQAAMGGKQTSMATPGREEAVDPIMQAVAKLKREGRDLDNPSPTPEGQAHTGGASAVGGVAKQRGGRSDGLV